MIRTLSFGVIWILIQ